MPTLREQLSRRHPDYERCAAFWRYYRDQYDGGPEYAFKSNPLAALLPPAQPRAGQWEGASRYVWQNEIEVGRRYTLRLARAVCINITAPVVDFYASTVGRQESVILRTAAALAPFVDNADLQGQSLLQFLSGPRIHAAVYGHTFLFVDSTRAAEPVRTQADAQRLGVRPYVFEIEPPDLLNWRLDRNGQVLEVLFRIAAPIEAEIFGESAPPPAVEYLHWTPSSWTRYRESGQDAVQVDEGENPIGVVPIVPLYHKRVENFRGQSLLKDAAKIQQLVTNWCSALDEALTMQMFAQPVLRSESPPAEVGVGTSVVLHLNPKDNEEFEYVAPDVGPFEASWDAFYRMVQLANKHMGIAPTSITGGQVADEKSGVSKQWDYVEAEKIMARMALHEQEAVKSALGFAMRWMGVTADEPEVEYATRFDLTTMAEEIANVIALQAAGIPETAQRELKRRLVNKSMPSLSEEIRKRIDQELDAPATAPGGIPAGAGAEGR